jgi:hypothetical protein
MKCVKSGGKCHPKLETVLLTLVLGGCGNEFCWKCKVIFANGQYKHFPGCFMIGGRFETSGTVPRPAKMDSSYREGYDADPDYVAGTSDTESWK